MKVGIHQMKFWIKLRFKHIVSKEKIKIDIITFEYQCNIHKREHFVKIVQIIQLDAFKPRITSIVQYLGLYTIYKHYKDRK